MAGSALYGTPPANDRDFAVVKAALRIVNVPESEIDAIASMGVPLMFDPGPTPPHNSHQGRIIARMSVVIFLLVLITGIRVMLRYTRKELKVGLDDLFAIIATLCACSWFAIVIGMATYGGAGKHIYDVTYSEMAIFISLGSVGQTIFWISVGLISVAITLFNRRLTGLTSVRWQRAHITFLVLLAIYIVTALFLSIFDCLPAGVIYDVVRYGSTPQPPKCMGNSKLQLALSIAHMTFEFALLCVPLVVLYIMQMSLFTKIRLGFLFSVGAVSCIASVVRQELPQSQNPDMTWIFQYQLSWSIVDLFFAITAASLPVLNVLLPTKWRASSNTPQLGNISILRHGKSKGSVKLGSNELISRPDGTVNDEFELSEPSDAWSVEKDSFTQKTEQRWNSAYHETVQVPAPSLPHDL